MAATCPSTEGLDLSRAIGIRIVKTSPGSYDLLLVDRNTWISSGYHNSSLAAGSCVARQSG
jgi:hypothetical protein